MMRAKITVWKIYQYQQEGVYSFNSMAFIYIFIVYKKQTPYIVRHEKSKFTFKWRHLGVFFSLSSLECRV